MADVSTWSPIDDNNNTAPPNGWPEGQMPSTVNNCGRGMMGAVRRWYDTVTAQIASLTTSLGNYLPLVGGTLSGALHGPYLHSTGNIQADNAVTTPYVHAGASGVLSDGNINGVNIGATGNVAVSGTVNSGYVHSTGNIQADHDVVALTNIYASSGTVTAVNLTATNAVTGSFVHSTSGVQADGGISAGGNITTGNTVTGGYIHSTGNIQADGTFTGGAVSVGGAVTGNYLHSTGNIDAGTYVYAPNGLVMNDAGSGTTYRMYSGGGISSLQFADAYAFQWNASGGALNYIAATTLQWVMRIGDFLTYNAAAPVGGNGAYINLSDRRGKTDIVPSTRGLDEILRLSPVEFKRVSRVSGQTGMDRRELGFIAQDVQGVLPEAVRTVGMTLPDGTGGLEDAEPSLGITDSTIVVALVNAVKELSTRLHTLEHRGDAA